MTVRLLKIWRFPVKSLLGEELPEAELGPAGLDGDRAWGVRARATGRVLSAKAWPGLFAFRASYPDGPNGEPAVSCPDGRTRAGADAAAALSAALKAEVELVRSDPARGAVYDYGSPRQGPKGSFFDAAPVHVLTEECLAGLRAAFPGGDFDPLRFRANLLVGGVDDAALLGRELAFPGGVRLSVQKLTGRCVMTTHAQGALPAEPGILRTIAKTLAGKTGVYARVLAPGHIKSGDSIPIS